jgi:hypothetical protein
VQPRIIIPEISGEKFMYPDDRVMCFHPIFMEIDYGNLRGVIIFIGEI